jgi:hypothetical protein
MSNKHGPFRGVEKEKITLYIAKDVRKSLEKIAIARGCSLSHVLDQLVMEESSRKKK